MNQENEMSLPPDPFLPEDLGQFGKNTYAMYAGLVQAGFSEPQALIFLAHLMANVMTQTINGKKAA